MTTLADLTTTKIGGTGAFDQLMMSTKAHLESEYKAGRIKGAEYATVYLGALVAVMQQAVAFLQVGQQDRLIDAQVAKITAELELVAVQKDNLILEGSNLALQGQLIDAQIDKLNAEMPKITAEIALINAQITKMNKENLLLDTQISKANAEVALLNQKTKTEVAQIREQVDGVGVQGVISRQKDLYVAQTNGFARDAEQKMLKIFADAFAVQRTTDEDLPVPTGLSSTAINAVATKARAGIGA